MRGPDRHDTAEFLERMYRLFRQLGSRLPTHDLKPGEKDTLGAGIFYGDAEMIDETAWALRHHPDLYPDILALGIHAGDLEEEQEQALWWLALGLYFGALASRAMDNHLRVRAGAGRKARRAIELVVAGFKEPALAPHLQHQRRLDHLMAAIRPYYDDRHKRGRQRGGPGKKGQRGAAAQPPPSAEARKARAEKTQKTRQAKKRKARIVARLDDLLSSVRSPG